MYGAVCNFEYVKSCTIKLHLFFTLSVSFWRLQNTNSAFKENFGHYQGTFSLTGFDNSDYLHSSQVKEDMWVLKEKITFMLKHTWTDKWQK
jgi:hypothetical protein